MLKDREIIYFANDYKTDHKVSSHHIANELLKYNKLLYVETGGMRKPRSSSRDLKRILFRLASWLKGVRKVEDNLYLYSLIIFPFHQKWAQRLNTFFNVFILHRTIKKHKFKDPILWFIAPHISYLADYFKSKLIVYYCTDNVAQMPEVNSQAIEKLEEDLLAKANVVFATSEYLCNRLKQKGINNSIFYSPHAVDFENFSRAQDNSLSIPQELKGLDKPVVGYIGLIEKWIDLDLIADIAKKRPQWQIVLIGRIAASIEALSSFRNVRCLGIKEFKELPFYLKEFDICISPFKINELTKSVNPIKIKEYLASGKPVVATKLPEMDNFKGYVVTAGSGQDFVEKIEWLLENDNGQETKKRMEFVKMDNWHNRVTKISETIEEITNAA